MPTALAETKARDSDVIRSAGVLATGSAPVWPVVVPAVVGIGLDGGEGV
ncbi:hypothetical protein [Streptomyces calidiresistens]|nr:hypothetical protein [Streptomyces calidiresistens]